MPSQSRLPAWALGGLLSLLLAACSGALLTRELTFSAAELQALVERHVARQHRVAEVIELTLERPQIRLVPERNRIVSTLDITALERVTGRLLRGSLSAEHTLRYESADATLRLAQVRVDDLQLDLGAGVLTGAAARLSGVIVERALDDAVVWRASEQQRDALQRAGVQRADIQVTARGVEVKFGQPR